MRSFNCILALALAIGAVLLTGCGGDDEGKGTGGTGTGGTGGTSGTTTGTPAVSSETARTGNVGATTKPAATSSPTEMSTTAPNAALRTGDGAGNTSGGTPSSGAGMGGGK